MDDERTHAWVLSAYTGSAGWMWVNDRASLPADEFLLLFLGQIADVSTAQTGKAPPLIGSVSSVQKQNFLDVMTPHAVVREDPSIICLYLIFQAFNLFNLALRG